MSIKSIDYARRDRIRNGSNPFIGIEDRRSSSIPQGRSGRLGYMQTVERQRQRSNTVYSYSPGGLAHDLTWQPGTEPGLDPDKHLPYNYKWESKLPDTLQQECEITVADFSETKMRRYELKNTTLEDFLSRERAPWVKCRWINVKGLNWDSIKTLRKHKRLHPLAVEDLVHTTSRTKADWYPGQAFITMTLQKLVDLQQAGSESEVKYKSSRRQESEHVKDSDTDHKNLNLTTKRKSSQCYNISTALKTVFRPTLSSSQQDSGIGTAKIDSNVFRGPKGSSSKRPAQFGNPSYASAQAAVRSLQRYHGGPNQDRTEFMERHASLASRKLAVTMEQVSIFLHDDNTVTSFFQSDIDEIELPLLQRLNSSETLLRQSCDASMLLQAILDALVDLAIPVTVAYQDVLGDLELEVLTHPDIEQSKRLYVLTSEIAFLRSSMHSVLAVINALREHRSPQADGRDLHHNPPNHHHTQTTVPENPGSSNIAISSMCHTYLGDVIDHLIPVVEEYDEIRRAADSMIDLIFNTIGAYQNRSMKQLTIFSCLFLPMGFLTAYFGMNFNKKEFAGINNSVSYFWKIAVPFAIASTLLLMRDKIIRFLVTLAHRHLIVSSKKQRQKTG
ncbi:hypothetical protein N7528_008597 [Penicillium herquei]|nr:hypothetical protein N7528_008597 [Penicillium herquei]